MDATELLIVAVMAVGWWIPTFIALAELQRREGVRRALVWKWMGLLCIPVWGYLRYFRHGRPELDADQRAQQRRPGRPAPKPGGSPGGAGR